MERVTRRGFVGSAGALTVGAFLPPASALAAPEAPGADRTVHLSGDGIGLTPRDYATLLAELTAGAEVAEDSYLLGGEVEAFERHWATLLGKETAVFMPSGTLANQLALRALAGAKRRVIVPEMSHIYNDTGDACQTLSALTLMPLAPNAATFTRAEIEAVLGAHGRAGGSLPTSAPSRSRVRCDGCRDSCSTGTSCCASARWPASAVSACTSTARGCSSRRRTPGAHRRSIAAPFDTVYVSLWKYFNCGQGAILAGPRRVLDGMFHTRRMFGGNLAVGWPAALVARHYMDGFVDSAARRGRGVRRVLPGDRRASAGCQSSAFPTAPTSPASR